MTLPALASSWGMLDMKWVELLLLITSALWYSLHYFWKQIQRYLFSHLLLPYPRGKRLSCSYAPALPSPPLFLLLRWLFSFQCCHFKYQPFRTHRSIDVTAWIISSHRSLHDPLQKKSRLHPRWNWEDHQNTTAASAAKSRCIPGQRSFYLKHTFNRYFFSNCTDI